VRPVNLTIKELMQVVEGCATSLDPAFLVKHIASLEGAGERDLAVLFDPEDNSVFAPVSIEKIKSCRAGLILASKPVAPGKNYLLVDDPLVALERLAKFLDERKSGKRDGVHELAHVGEFAVIEDGVTIDSYAVVQDDAKIGYGAKIGSHVYIGRGCQIGCHTIVHPGAKILDRCVVGENSIIHAGAVIGSDGFGYRVMKTGLQKVPHVGIVRIGSWVEVGANVTIDRAEFEETVVGDGVKIDNGVHIAHNVKIGLGTAILAQTGIAGSTIIGLGCQIGGQVAIKDHLVIGNYVKIVSKSAVMKNLKDGEVVCGIPSVPFSQWKRIAVSMMTLPDAMKSFKETKKNLEKRKMGGFWRFLRG